MAKPGQNSEGYADPTASAALKPVEDEEIQVAELIKAIKIILRICGYNLLNRIEIQNKKSRRTYR